MLVLILAVIIGITKAVMDTLNDHWADSVFYRWSGGNREAFWGHRDLVYRRRYGDDGKLLWPFRIPILSGLVESVWDGWHLMSTVQIAAALGIAWGLSGLSLWYLGAAWLLYFVSFEIPYRAL